MPSKPSSYFASSLGGSNADASISVGVARRAEETLERHDAYGAVRQAGRVEWIGCVSGQ